MATRSASPFTPLRNHGNSGDFNSTSVPSSTDFEQPSSKNSPHMHSAVVSVVKQHNPSPPTDEAKSCSSSAHHSQPPTLTASTDTAKWEIAQAITTANESSLKDILVLMTEHRIHRVYLADTESHPIGVITMLDIMQVFATEDLLSSTVAVSTSTVDPIPTV
uniref:Inosine-5'-monophosphate dehydrogenase n=1 Tax=Lygus hesperus TaxID=30085 RepID=A0A0A9WA01_LYGHE